MIATDKSDGTGAAAARLGGMTNMLSTHPDGWNDNALARGTGDLAGRPVPRGPGG